MDSWKRLELFPDRWVKKMSDDEILEGRQQLKAYTTSPTMDTSLKEVCNFILITDGIQRPEGVGCDLKAHTNGFKPFKSTRKASNWQTARPQSSW